MQSLQKALVCTRCFLSNFDRVKLDVEYLESHSAAVSSCVWMAKVDDFTAVVAWSDWTYPRGDSFDLVDGYKRWDIFPKMQIRNPNFFFTFFWEINQFRLTVVDGLFGAQK